MIRLVVMMYVRYPLSPRNVEDLLHERGIDICHETVRLWWTRFGPMFAAEIRRKRVAGHCQLRRTFGQNDALIAPWDRLMAFSSRCRSLFCRYRTMAAASKTEASWGGARLGTFGLTMPSGAVKPGVGRPVRVEQFVESIASAETCSLFGNFPLVPRMGTCDTLPMRVIAKRTLIEFCGRLPAGEVDAATEVMIAWHTVTEAADWSSFAEAKQTFNSADWVGKGKVVFDVGGNKYRIVGLIGFKSKRVYILFVGTHKEYDDIDVTAL